MTSRVRRGAHVQIKVFEFNNGDALFKGSASMNDRKAVARLLTALREKGYDLYPPTEAELNREFLFGK
jgi:hypothetical protein